MNQPILTIAIPTYNRATFLENNLKQLYNNWQQLNDKNYLEIIISNNASTDNTKAIVQQFVDLGLPIRFFNNVINLRADGNFYNCYENATGKYLWIFGDDELLFNTALPNIVEILQENELGCLYVRGIGYDNKFDLEKYNIIKSEEIEWINSDLYLEKINYYLTFCTGNIFNKSLIPSDFNPKEFIGSNLNQVSWYLMALNNAQKNCILKEKYYFIKNSNTGGYKLFETFSTNLNLILKKYTSNKNRKLINNQLLTSFFPIFIHQRKSFIKEKGFWVLFKNYYTNKIFWKNFVFLQLYKNFKRKCYLKQN